MESVIVDWFAAADANDMEELIGLVTEDVKARAFSGCGIDVCRCLQDCGNAIHRAPGKVRLSPE